MFKRLFTMGGLSLILFVLLWSPLALLKQNPTLAQSAADGLTVEAALVFTPTWPTAIDSNKYDFRDSPGPVLPRLAVDVNSYRSGDFFFPPYLSESDRMGYGRASDDDASVLNAGWYVDWNARNTPPHPAGAEYARTIYFQIKDTGSICSNRSAPATQHSQVTARLTGTQLINVVTNNPGAVWLIGNEPDSIYNGNPIQAELYAELYHHFYTKIKAADPTAKIAIAAIVQPSALRLAYLDRVLSHYQARYGTPMPIDLWNIHFYILDEIDCGAGAGLPPFIEGPGVEVGFEPEALLNLDAMRQGIVDMRQWMYDRGYDDMPLIITEFGVLMPPNFRGFENDVAARFLHDMFDLLRTTTDPVIGYQADGGRLVQKWAWFSTNHFYGGDLFCGGDTDNKENDSNCAVNPTGLTLVGDAFIQQTRVHRTDYVDLQPLTPLDVVTDNTTLSVNGYVQNRGNSDLANATARFTLVDAESGLTVVTKTLDTGGFLRRYATDPSQLTATWGITYTQQPTQTVPYTLSLSVLTVDANTANNQASQVINWWPLSDLAMTNLQGSVPLGFRYQVTQTVLVTATVTNQGPQPGAAQVDFVLQNPDQRMEVLSPSANMSLSVGQTARLTTTFQITGVGRYDLRAELGQFSVADFNANNQQLLTVVAAQSQLYLPLLLQ